MTDPSSGPLGVALLGFGFAGQIFHAPFITTTPGLRLRVVASSREAAVHADYPEVGVTASPVEAIGRDDVDLVVIATPNETHASLADAALRAGRHVVVDKPFTITLDEALALVATATTTGRLLSVFQNRRFDSDFLAVRQAVEAGTIGEVVEYRSEIARWRPEVRDRWRERPGPGAGLWYDLGPHLVDQAVQLFGVPEGVQATIRTLRPGGRTDDWFCVRLAYQAREVLVASSTLAADAPARFVVRGTTGSLVKQGSDPQERRLLAGERPGSPGWGHDDDPLLVLRDGADVARRPAPAGNYGQFYAGMHDAARLGGPPPVSMRDATVVMAIITAGLQSAATGRAVRMSDLLAALPAG